MSAETLGSVEQEKPKYRLMVTRHAERLPSGELSEEGKQRSQEKGQSLKESTEVIKGYASDEKSKRTIQTSDLISKASKTKSPMTGEIYRTKVVSDIQYDILKPDLAHIPKQAKKVIDQATAEEAGLAPDTDLESLPKEEQERIAPIRQKNQELGFRYVLEQPEAVHRMAMGLAHQLSKELKLIDRYTRFRDYKQSPAQKDVILNTVTHGMFSEALFMEAGVLRKADGTEVRGADIINDPDFGGFIQPAESFYLDIENPDQIPDVIPVRFEGRNVPGTFMLDRKKIEGLNEEYLNWDTSQ